MNIIHCNDSRVIAAVLRLRTAAGHVRQRHASPIDELSTARRTRAHRKQSSRCRLSAVPTRRLTAYSKLLLRPIEVQFAKNWDPASSGSALYKMNEPDREKIKSELATVFAEVFKRDMRERRLSARH